MDLMKGEENVARDKVIAPKQKEDCLTSTNLTMSEVDELTRF